MDNNQGTSGTVHKKKSGGMRSWIFIILTVVVVAGIGATAFALLKNSDPMTRYLTAEKETMEEQMSMMDERLTEMMELQDKMLDTPYKSDSTITADFNVEGAEQTFGPMLPMIKGLVSSAKIETTQMLNQETKETFLAFDVLLQGSSLGNAEVYQSEDTTAVKTFLYDDYLSLKNDQLNPFIERMGGTPEPTLDKIPALSDYMTSTLTYEQLEEMGEDYLKAMIKELDSEQFTMEDGVEYEGEKYDKVTLTLTENETKEMIKTLLTTMKETNIQLGGAMESDTQIEDGKAAFDEMIAEVDNMNIPDGVKLDAYLDGDTVVYRDITTKLGPSAEEMATINMKTSYLEESEDAYTSTMDVSVTPENEEGTLVINLVEKGKEESEDTFIVDHDFTFSMDEGDGPSKIGVKANSEFTKGASETTFDLVMEGPMFAGSPMPEIGGTLNTEFNMDGDKADQKVVFGIDFAMEDPMTGNISGDVEFTVDTKTEFSNDLEFPAPSEGETVNLMEASDSEIQQIMMEMQTNLENYYQQMFGSFGAF
ncbi:hypothetical protein [Thalassobacillus hwangdonensis]|uniref:Uncharacterized protein n=1 Tax=Thalassobacillus hwangdonensis TaxID=546108 RepID=A0ABW3KWY7_9BACI